MIYLSNTDDSYIPDLRVIDCDNDERKALLKEYHQPDAKELYDYIERQTDKTGTWDAVGFECYDALAYMLDIDTSSDYDCGGFMDACKKALDGRD